MRTGGKGEWYSYGYAPMLQTFGADQIDRSTYRTADCLLNAKHAVAWREFYHTLFA
jgi:multiple sugar transport system substrate-binding protein